MVDVAHAYSTLAILYCMLAYCKYTFSCAWHDEILCMHDGILQVHAGIGHADHADMMPLTMLACCVYMLACCVCMLACCVYTLACCVCTLACCVYTLACCGCMLACWQYVGTVCAMNAIDLLEMCL